MSRSSRRPRRLGRSSVASLLAPCLVLAGCARSNTPKSDAPTATPAETVPAGTSATAPTTAPTTATSADASAPNESAAAAAPTDAEIAADVRAANDVAMKLYARVEKKSPGNLMLSGTSLRQALGMTAAGARGATARELSTALELPHDASAVAKLAKAEAAAWEEARGKEAQLVLANRVWVDKAFPLKDAYTSLVSSAFGASAAPVDFAHAPDKARGEVNAWVSEKTAGKIPDLLAKGTVDARTRVVLTNALYFKGRWAEPFPKGATKDAPFHLGAKGKDVKAPMMRVTASFKMAEAAGAKAVELPYEGSGLAMLLVVPNDVAGLGKIEAHVAKSGVDAWTKALESKRVAVTMPRFSFRAGGSLNAALRAMGIKVAFSDKADFSGMSERGKELDLSEVVQKTWIKVDEHGTEAAAATGVVMRTTSLPIGPIAEVKADRPFLFVVRETKHGRVLFVGRVTDPTKS